MVKTFVSYGVRTAASERNGVGAWPTDDLKNRLVGKGTWVKPVWTDARRKMSGFGKLRMLIQSGRIILPRHPELLKQLRSLQFEQTVAGQMRISVPENLGHDDLAMALMQAVSAADPRMLRDEPAPFGVTPPNPDTTVLTAAGVSIPRRPIPSGYGSCFWMPSGAETGDGW